METPPAPRQNCFWPISDSVIDLPWAGTREIGNTGFRFVRVDLITEGVLQVPQ